MALRLSRRHFAANVAGALLAGAGVTGLSGAAKDVAVLGNTYADLMLLALGLTLMCWFYADLMKRIRAAGKGRTQQANH
jgi:hypothetical protein